MMTGKSGSVCRKFSCCATLSAVNPTWAGCTSALSVQEVNCIIKCRVVPGTTLHNLQNFKIHLRGR